MKQSVVNNLSTQDKFYHDMVRTKESQESTESKEGGKLSELEKMFEIEDSVRESEGVVKRVVLENFDMTAKEMARHWAEQDKYIDLLESQLRQSEEKLSKLLMKSSQRVHNLIIKRINKEQEVHEMKAQIAVLKAALTPTSVMLRPILLEQIKHDHEYSIPLQRVSVGIKHDHDYSAPSHDAGPEEPESESSAPRQRDHSKKSSKARKFSEDEIKKGSLLMFSSLKTYNLLRTFGDGRYPCPRTLRRHIQSFRCRYGLNEEMFFVLHQKLATVPEADRNVSLVFDEMDIQPKTQYSSHFKERIPQSKKALVLMVRGLRSGFKEVVYYNFDTLMMRERGKAAVDLEFLEGIIHHVENAGGSVRAITLDMGNKTILSECKVNINFND